MIIIGYIHILIVILLSTYVLWGRPQWDTYYLIILLSILFSWVVLKNECIVSYLYKLSLNPNYKLGQDHRPQDFIDVLGANGSKAFVYYLIVMYLLNLIIISWRLHADIKIKFWLVCSIINYIAYISLRKVVPNLTIFSIVYLITIFVLVKNLK
jgi:hypothetical protein